MLMRVVLYLHEVGSLQAAFCMEARQQPLFQVHHSLANEIVPTKVVVVHHLNLQILYVRNGRFKLEHPTCK